jgi:hypothetical protein
MSFSFKFEPPIFKKYFLGLKISCQALDKSDLNYAALEIHRNTAEEMANEK